MEIFMQILGQKKENLRRFEPVVTSADSAYIFFFYSAMLRATKLTTISNNPNKRDYVNISLRWFFFFFAGVVLFTFFFFFFFRNILYGPIYKNLKFNSFRDVIWNRLEIILSSILILSPLVRVFGFSLFFFFVFFFFRKIFCELRGNQRFIFFIFIYINTVIKKYIFSWKYL